MTMVSKATHELLLDSEAALRLITIEVTDGLQGLEEPPPCGSDPSLDMAAPAEQALHTLRADERLQIHREIGTALDRLREGRRMLQQAPSERRERIGDGRCLRWPKSPGGASGAMRSRVTLREAPAEMPHLDVQDRGERPEEEASKAAVRRAQGISPSPAGEDSAPYFSHAEVLLDEVEDRLRRLLRFFETEGERSPGKVVAAEV